MSNYTVRAVDGSDDETAIDIALLHDLTFGRSANRPDTSIGDWWLVFESRDPMPVAFAGLTPSTAGPRIGYLKRVGVLRDHCGQGLQRRLIRVRIAKAKRNGWDWLLTDTTDNPQSANNLAACGFKMFTPQVPWAFQGSLYWRYRLC